MPKSLSIIKILQTQGFGSRRACEILVGQGCVAWAGDTVQYIDDTFEVAENAPFTVDGILYSYKTSAYILMNKPAGYECSQKPKLHPSVYELLPPYLRQRGSTGARDGVQCVGRLDQDTTGLLLMSDDGQFIHRYTSPKKQVFKTYQVTCKHEIEPALITALTTGVVLRDAMGDTPEPVTAKDIAVIDPHTLHMSISEGRYHQVKRMIAAAGNRCEALHRIQVGHYLLPPTLALGEWCFVDAL